MQSYIKEEVWQQILERLKQFLYIHKKDIFRLRRFVEGVHYVMRSGIQWRLLPPIMVTLGVYITDSSDEGIWSGLFEETTQNSDFSEVMSDGIL